jgi:hypothetical protein
VVFEPHETASGRPSGSGPVIGVAPKRTLALTGALEQRTPPQLVTLDPARAADHVRPDCATGDICEPERATAQGPATR